MRVVELLPRTDAWHAWRNAGITATDARVLMGTEPSRTVWQLWAEKVGLVQPPDLSRNPHVRHGVLTEPEAREAFEAHAGVMLLPVCGESDTQPILRASFDGVDDDGIPVELKCPSESVFNEVVANGEQSEQYKRYYPQVQHQIEVAGAPHGFLVFYRDTQLQSFKVLRDDAFIAELMEKGLALWDAIDRKIEPAKDPKLDMFIPTGEALDQWMRLAETYRELENHRLVRADEIDKIQRRQKMVEQQLIGLLGNFAHGAAAGVRITRYLQRGSVDFKKALKELLQRTLTPTEEEQYRRNASERVRVDVTDKSVPPRALDIESLSGFFDEDGGEEGSLYF